MRVPNFYRLLALIGLTLLYVPSVASAAEVKSTPPISGPKPTIAVYAESPKQDGAPQFVDSLNQSLVDSGIFSVVDREHVQDILKSQNESTAGQVTPATEMQLGRMLGVRYLVIAKVDELQTTQAQSTSGQTTEQAKGIFGIMQALSGDQVHATVSDAVTIVDTRNGQIIQSLQDSRRVSMPSSSGTAGVQVRALRASAAHIVATIDRSKFSGAQPMVVLQGRILDVTGDTVVLSIGSSRGVNVGDTFDVFATRYIENPDTGRKVRIDIRKGSVQVIQSDKDYSIAKPLDGFHATKFQIVKGN